MESNCRICKSKTNELFKAKIMNKYDIQYYECPSCDFIQVESPYWLEESYASPINLSDTGIIYRNLNYQKIVAVLLYFLFGSKNKFVDYAGGYGIFTRIMRDIGFDYYWDDPYTKNLVARGFEHTAENGKVEAITSFETFEHLVEPVPETEKMMKFSDTIIFSTQIAPTPAPKSEDWWYYGLEHGQHTALYRKKSLETLGTGLGLKLYTNGTDLHVFTKSDLVPFIASAKQIKQLQKQSGAGDISNFYESFDRPKLIIRSVKRSLKAAKTFWQQKGYRKLKENLTEQERRQLANLWKESGLLDSYVAELLSFSGANWRLVQNQLQSLTFSDMLNIRDTILSK